MGFVDLNTLQNPTPGAAILSTWGDGVRDNFVYLQQFRKSIRTAGHVAVVSTAFVAVDTAMDLTLPNVAAGETVEVELSGLWENQAFFAELDIATVVGGVVQNRFGTATRGWVGWHAEASRFSSMTGAAWKTLVAGDISGGSVTLRLLARLTAAGSRTLCANTELPLQMKAKSLGP